MEQLSVFWNGVDERTWSEALDQAPRCALQQSWAYGDAIGRQCHEVYRAGLRLGDRLVGMAQIAERRLFGALRIALLMRGPVWIDSDATLLEPAFIEEIAHRLAGSVLLWTPEILADADNRHRLHNFRRVLTGYSTIMLGLQNDLATIEGGLHGKWRNMLRANEKRRLQIVDVRGGRLLNWLIRTNETYRQQVGYAGPSPEFIASLGETNPTDCRRAWVACHEGEPVAGIIVEIHGNSATYYAGCTTPTGRQMRAHHGLLWHAVKYLHGAKIRQFDLGGIDTEKAPGVARFKLGMGGQVTTLAGTYLVPPKFTGKTQQGPLSPAALEGQDLRSVKAA